MNEDDVIQERCSYPVIHKDIVQKVRENLPDESQLADLAELFKIFGDQTRIRIMSALFEAELCVCDIACLLEMTQSAISHQLRLLKQASLVRNRKAGKVVYYALNDEHIKRIFDQGLIHIRE
jgi:ArsR family transcriptional regulator, lead/cadmium/zinc/bismuth-responsive transcriptional repressor